MNRDPLGLGALLYGAKAIEWSGVDLTMFALVAGGASMMSMAHHDCALSTFCKNPLHPGPCKGWKKKLGIEAPGALKAIESAHKEKLAVKRAKMAEAKSAGAARATAAGIVSPLHHKKAMIKHANVLLGNDEAKASGKADKVILNKAEIKKYSKIKAAHVNSIREQHGLLEVPGLDQRFADALDADNKTGKDTEYHALLSTLGGHMGKQLAVQHCHKGNHKECDDQIQGALAAHLAGLAEHALLTGDSEQLGKALADWDAGKLDLTPAAPVPDVPAGPAVDLVPLDTAKPKSTLAQAGLKVGDKATLHTKDGPITVTVTKSAKGLKKTGGSGQVLPVYHLVNEKDGKVVALGSGTAKYPIEKFGAPNEPNVPPVHVTAPNAVPAAPDAIAKKPKVSMTEVGVGDQLVSHGYAPYATVSGQVSTVAKIEKIEDPPGSGKHWIRLLDEHGDAIASGPEDTKVILHAPGVDAAAQKAAKASPTAPAPGSVYLPGDAKLTDLHKMFGADGDPDHGDVTDAVGVMSQDDYNSLTPSEKDMLDLHVNDAAGYGAPGADAAKAKLDAFKLNAAGSPADTSSPTVSGVLTPEAQEAKDVAHGVKSMVAKKKLVTYEKVSGKEFEALDPDSQKLILADLLAIKGKFLDPKKKQQAQDHHDYLSTFMGGGTGAGGGGNAGVEPGGVNLAKALDDLPEMANITNPPGYPLPDSEGQKEAFKGMAETGFGHEGAANFLAPVWADNGLKKLNEIHHHDITGEAIADAKSALAADIHKKLMGTGEPTPVYDAFKKAVENGSEEDASHFLELAANANPAPATSTLPTALPTHADHEAKAAKLASLWKSAAPNEPQSSISDHETAVSGAGAGGYDTTTWEHFTSYQGGKIAVAAMGSGFTKAGLPIDDKAQLLNSPSGQAVYKAMQAEATQAVKDGDSAVPAGGHLQGFNDAVAAVDTAGSTLASANGWSENSPTVVAYKKQLMQAKLDELAKGAAVPDHGVPAYVPPTTSTVTPLGTDPSIAHIPFDKQQEILGDLKAMPSGKYLSDPKETTYGNLLALASAHGTADQPLSVMQVLKSIDNAFSKQLGVANGNKWENEFVDWLKTPAGKAFADANPTPDANLVQKLKGVYDGPSTDMQELSKKVKLLPGPGKFDAAKPSSDFQVVNTAEATKLREQMLADGGGKYSSSELSGIKTYTGSSYTTMNSYLRGQTSDISAHYKTAIKNTQAAMRPLPQDVLLHRGTGWAQLPEGFNSPEKAKKLIGKTILDEAFVSTSVGGGAAFGGPLLLEIEAPKGTHAAYVEGVSSHNGEREMLLAAGQHFQILSVTTKGHQTVLRMRVVDAT